MYNRETSPLGIKSYSFAVRIVKMVKYLPTDYKLLSLYNQILRSGTSISSNISESQFAQSSADFQNKLYIALKEANETMNWLNLFKDTDIINEEQFKSMSSDCSELIAMLVSSIKTNKKNN